jgi:hypothetical protein
LVGCWRLLLGAPLAGPAGTEVAEVADGMGHSRWDVPKSREEDTAVEEFVHIVLVYHYGIIPYQLFKST